jgi:hypothetical protein
MLAKGDDISIGVFDGKRFINADASQMVTVAPYSKSKFTSY